MTSVRVWVRLSKAVRCCLRSRTILEKRSAWMGAVKESTWVSASGYGSLVQ
jgi:hypothetical protein